jgi:hypothetical protein
MAGSVDLGGKRVFDGKGVVKDVPGAFGASREPFVGGEGATTGKR